MSEPISDSALRFALEKVLSAHSGTRRNILRLVRRPSSYSSSFALEELDVCLDDNTQLQLVFKNENRRALSKTAEHAKPKFLYNPLREIETYRSILQARPWGTPIFYGAVVEPRLGEYWLFLEKVGGTGLNQSGEIEYWSEAARWLARLHEHFASKVNALATSGFLLRYDEKWYLQWLERARKFAGRSPFGHDLARLRKRYPRVITQLTNLPVTFIHGEFYAPNVLIQSTERNLRVCPVDWEMAALGPGLMDVAALIAGQWSEEEKTQLAMEYYDALSDPDALLPRDDFLMALECCRLHLALQWLGWSRTWSPPPEHAQDWMQEALRCADKLGL